MSDFKLPVHKAGLQLSHNEHKNTYDTVEEYTGELMSCGKEDPNGLGDWISQEQKDKAIATQDFWELHWYPDTPVGFYRLWAADLDSLLKVANDKDFLRDK